MSKRIRKRILNYTVIFEPAQEGGFIIHVPALPGCHTQAETLDEAYKMAQEAILGYIQVLREMQEEIPEEKSAPIITRIPVKI